MCWCCLVFSINAIGKGCVYSFDPVGSYDRETYRAGGSASSMLQPLLDNQVTPLPLPFILHFLCGCPGLPWVYMSIESLVRLNSGLGLYQSVPLSLISLS